MRLAIVTPEYPPFCGGIGYYVKNLAKKLSEEMDVCVITRGKKNAKVEGNIPIYYAKFIPPAPLTYILNRKAIESAISDFGADIVNMHSTSMPLLRLNLPVILTAHWCNAEGIKRFHRPIITGDDAYRNFFYSAYKRQERSLCRNSVVVTCVSDSIAEELRKHHCVDAVPVYNGVDWKIFDKPEKKLKQVMFVGKLHPGKGVIDLAEVSKHIDCNILVFGEGPLKNRLSGYKNIELMGRVKQEELIRYYNQSLAYVFPSRYEGLPNGILEAMASGLPIITTDVSGNRDLVKDGLNGYIAETKEFAQRISFLIKDEVKMKEMGDLNKRIVREKYDWNNVRDRFMQVISDVR